MSYTLYCKRIIVRKASLENNIKRSIVHSLYLNYRVWHDVRYSDLGVSRSVEILETVGGVFRKDFERFKKFSFNINKWEF